MLTQKIFRCWSSIANRRFISQSAKTLESKASESVSKTSSSKTSETNESILGPIMVAPSDFDKWVLVWMKKYPKGQVPDRVKAETLYQTKSRARVKGANYLIAITIVMLIGGVYLGKSAAKSGESIQKRNQEWHRKHNEAYQKEQELLRAEKS